MSGRTILIILLSLLALLLISGTIFAACTILDLNNQPTQDSSAAYTQAAQTIIAQVTQDSFQTAIVQLTEIAGVFQTATAQPGYFTPTPFPSPTYIIATIPPTLYPSATSPVFIPPTSTPPPLIPCNKATFIKDVTIPDGTLLPPNTNFQKVWRIRNDGTCTWDRGYNIFFASGTPMTSYQMQAFPGNVLPGQTVDLAIDMTSPNQPNNYTSSWLLRSSVGQTFGTGSNGSTPLSAKIRVSLPPTPNPKYAYDFTSNYCSAQWRTGSGAISCTNSSTDTRGSVTLSTNPPLESRVENEPGLITIPNQANDGSIQGLYPPYVVKAGDYFVTEISCQNGFNNCDVTFRLDYQLANGFSGNLGSWREVYDNKTRVLFVDLSSLVGQSVQFILRMQNNGNVSQAKGIWLLPSIRKNVPTNTPLPPTVTPTPTPTSTVTFPPTITPTGPATYPSPIPPG